MSRNVHFIFFPDKGGGSMSRVPTTRAAPLHPQDPRKASGGCRSTALVVGTDLWLYEQRFFQKHTILFTKGCGITYLINPIYNCR